MDWTRPVSIQVTLVVVLIYMVTLPDVRYTVLQIVRKQEATDHRHWYQKRKQQN